MRIERNTVTADAGAGGELHEPEWLGRSSIDDFPDVYAKLVADDLHLVNEPDVDRSEGVLEKLHQLRRLGARYPHDPLEAGLIERARDLGTRRRDASDDLGSVPRVPHGVAGVDTLRAESE